MIPYNITEYTMKQYDNCHSIVYNIIAHIQYYVDTYNMKCPEAGAAGPGKGGKDDK